MRKKILAFVFAGALLVGTAIPALADNPGLAGQGDTPADSTDATALCTEGVAHGGTHSAGQSGTNPPDNCP